MVHSVLEEVANDIYERSRQTRDPFLDRMQAEADNPSKTVRASCGSCSGLAHVYAGAPEIDLPSLIKARVPNIGIVSAATDMLSAHEIFYRFPDIIKNEARKNRAVAQIISQVTSICDGTVQGREGMELSLFSRDAIAMSAVTGLSHNISDAIVALGTCDKIKPGLIMGLSDFAHLPVIFAPGGPMSTGQTNAQKQEVRQVRAREKAGLVEETVGLEGELRSEMASYHEPGTCTFYGTANGNEMIAEFMGLQLPGSSFVYHRNPLRDALTRAATGIAARKEVPPLYKILNERSFVNGIVGMVATGGSTNLTLHFGAMARANGLEVTWEDMAKISAVVPTLAKIYPSNPDADINDFQRAGGTALVINHLLNAGLLHEDVVTVAGEGMQKYTMAPYLDSDGNSAWQEGPKKSRDTNVIRGAKHRPFSKTGGMQHLKGRLGEAVSKVSGLKKENLFITAPARVFNSQEELHEAFNAGELTGDMIAVVRGQGPHQNGMPELHKLFVPLKEMQSNGLKVGLITNGRLSGASGGIPAAIHLSSGENYADEPINKIRNGDIITIDNVNGILEVDVPAEEWDARTADELDLSANEVGNGREAFAFARKIVGPAHRGASFVHP